MTLPDDEVVDQMVAAFTPRLATGAIVVDHTTPRRAAPRRGWRGCNDAGVRFLHAPVFMSPQMARDAIGIMLVSGPRAVFDAVASRSRR